MQKIPRYEKIKKMSIFIGIDPGKSGFVTTYDPLKDEYKFFEMPTHKVDTDGVLKSGVSKTKTEFNESGLRDIVFNIKKEYDTQKFEGYIEEVTGRHGWSAENNFSFGHTAGMQRMILIMLGAAITSVRPQKWQSEIYQGFQKVMIPSSTGKTKIHDTKATSAIVSKALRPDIDFRKTARSKKVDDNKTDSFLICVYGYRQFLKNNKELLSK